MVQKFLSRAELLPEDETVQEHDKAREQEAKVVAADRSGRGLFEGLFRPTGFGFAHHHRPAILDQEDGVDRCPQCTWELEDGGCLHCGWTVSDDETGDSIDMGSVDLDSSDEEDPDFSDVDAFGEQIDVHVHPPSRPHRPLSLFDRHRAESTAYPAGSVSPRYYSDDDDEEDEEEDGEMDSFIENDEDLPNEVDDDGASVETVQGNRPVSGLPFQAAPPIPGQFQFYGLDTEDEDSGEEDSIATGDDMAEATTNDESSAGDESDGSSSASSEPSVQEIPPPQPRGRANLKRRIILSEDEDSSEIESEANGFSSLDEESDDTAIRPPQARSARQRRLRQRARTSSNSPHTLPERSRVAVPQRIRADRIVGSLRGSAQNVMHTARRGGRVSTRVH